MNHKKTLSFYLFFLLCLPTFLAGYDYNLAICCIFKDNSSYLKEWIGFHRMVGVEHFYLYDNGSTDRPEEVLEPYIKNNIVTIIPWPNQREYQWNNLAYAWVKTTQLTAYSHACNHVEGKVKWLALIDTDEFIVPVQDDSISSFLNKHQDVGGISVRWQVYGTSGVYDVAPNELMIELLMLKCHPGHYLNTRPKLIVRPESPRYFLSPHECIYKKKKRDYSASIEEIRINHYMNRTEKFFYEQKVKAKETMDNMKLPGELVQELLQTGNDVEDRIMDRFIPALRERMGFKL